ncbi:cytochrome b [Shewanella surugensis]|uniref:Cytochrome b/b6 domain-containing protein n=1 Tax=Shewanella surugensis TaxID=212020 RepID=A0ABT0LJ68_9GAMM|nr:cytochrome b/b6 domain-containing protein [Shewanella surugensis]MCL1127756.1 cytochrome b/b6 domain-containing protein [Shewanella surugensis]
MLSNKNESQEYDFLSKLFHWFMAIIIVYTMLAGFSLHIIDEHSSLWFFISQLNISLAFLSALIFIPRWVWSFFRTEPAQVTMPTLQRNVANMFHSLLYLLMFFVYITGFLMLSEPVVILGHLNYVNPLIQHDNICDLFFIFHRFSCYFLFFLIIIHVLAVIKHQYIDKNHLLNKMLF